MASPVKASDGWLVRVSRTVEVMNDESGEYWTRYAVIGAPPLEAGAVQLIVAEALPALTDTLGDALAGENVVR